MKSEIDEDINTDPKKIFLFKLKNQSLIFVIFVNCLGAYLFQDIQAFVST